MEGLCLAINPQPWYSKKSISDKNLKQIGAHYPAHISLFNFSAHKIFIVTPLRQFGFLVAKKGIIQSTRGVWCARCSDAAIRWKLNLRLVAGYLSRCADKTGRRLNCAAHNSVRLSLFAPRRRGWWVIIIYWAARRRRITKNVTGSRRNHQENEITEKA